MKISDGFDNKKPRCLDAVIHDYIQSYLGQSKFPPEEELRALFIPAFEEEKKRMAIPYEERMGDSCDIKDNLLMASVLLGDGNAYKIITEMLRSDENDAYHFQKSTGLDRDELGDIVPVERMVGRILDKLLKLAPDTRFRGKITEQIVIVLQNGGKNY